LQGEVQDSFGSQLNLLTLGCGLNATTQTATGSSANASPLSASGESADDCANRGAGDSNTNA
jgi:hypothetical protein